ncbi:uncharacterized protein LOC116783189 isoform X2 [Chiroxiphia lanceolata]|uniref:uncharacterized protein LOC116783189 isoform X2 n=1 Tax=Chiroxiphia lanceolata TaxID=296741 RepID=UPI0013CF3F62|nr:uncharacterized protein LOC116783189 isoform X2 [Chiroxiphia lanceolata]
MHELQPGTEEDSSNVPGIQQQIKPSDCNYALERQHGVGREAGISTKGVIFLYQILYSSKLLNGTEALWIVGHMRKLSSTMPSEAFHLLPL